MPVKKKRGRPRKPQAVVKSPPPAETHALSNVGRVLKQMREDARLNGDQLGERLGIGRPGVYRYEAPDSNSQAKTIGLVMQATGHTLWDLARISDEIAGTDTRPTWAREATKPAPPTLTLDALEHQLHHWMSQSEEGRKRLKELGVAPVEQASKKSR